MRELDNLGNIWRDIQERLSPEERRDLERTLTAATDAVAFLETKYIDALRDREVVHSLLEKTSADLVRRYQTTFEYSGTAMMVLERDGRISLANSHAKRMLGYSAEEIGSSPRIFQFTDASLEEKIRLFLQKTNPAGDSPSLQLEGQVTRSNGEMVSVTGTLGRFPETGQCILSLLDISERRYAEEALALANKKLNLLNSVTRHDVNNKLLTLEGYLQLASGNPDTPPAVRTFLKKSLDSTSHIEELIAFTRYYQDLGMRHPDWHNATEEILGAAAHISHEGVVVRADLGGLLIYTDPLIQKVFYNLIDNALRHGEHVTEISFTLIHEQNGFVIICTDNGTGIPADEKERVFERGVGKNTGLGLFLIREILSITGITIRETGTFGKGCRFEIQIPQKVGRIAEKDSGEGSSLQGSPHTTGKK
ncbi:sensor histidine kinase [Methanoregula sp. UBA64]|jgi:PAS domain S-box-containing protein|uniref:sensor histidine kinase n=1 Tax=Methanoregula sp. UBA64 TaxID=1915554 RepID=UPI0025DC32FA|nr:PAS domain-containing sensor histidine kinase [Methanoregula sp. UBA64]